MSDLLAKIERLVAAERLFPAPGRWVVAVSGGQDSLCLLHALLRLAPAWGLDLHVAHLDHQFRGAESAADARFVADLARAWGLPVTIWSADVPGYARQHRLSPQAAARAVRYQALARTVVASGAAGAVVGHTRDDVAETLLLNLLRGTGLRGLASLRPVTVLDVDTLGPPHPTVAPPPGTRLRVVRPLLAVERRETGAYCRAHGLEPRVEAGKEQAPDLRSRIRHELLPVLERLRPEVRATLVQAAELFADAAAIVESAADAALARVAAWRAEEVELDRPGLAALPPALRRQALWQAAARLAGTTEGLSALRSRAVEELTLGAQPSGRVHLPHRLELARVGDRLVLRRQRPARPERVVPTWLRVPGRTAVPGLGEVAADLLPVEPPVDPRRCVASPDPLLAHLDADRVGGPLLVRGRLPGDSFVPLGMAGRKKLQDYLVDRKLPAERRDAVAIVAAPRGIVWVVGEAIDDRVKVTPETRRILRLRVRPDRPADARWPHDPAAPADASDRPGAGPEARP